MSGSLALRTFALVAILVLAGCTAGIAPSGSSPDRTAVDSSTGSLAQGVTVTVTHVTDGDTMDVRFPDGHEDTVRLLGVDTPEVSAENQPREWENVPGTDAGTEWLQTWGEKASQFATTELDGATVRIQTDPAADRRGGYGRLLVYLSTPDTDRSFNRQLLERGYARFYDTDFSRREAFAAAEQRARESKTGVWSFQAGSSATATLQSNTGSIPLELVRIHADATGNDNENLNDEYLVFENTGAEPLDLSGWTVADEADHAYTFPDGFVLAPDEHVT